MNDTRFDAWTRRRVGVTAGGAAASLLGLTRLPSTAKKRCKRLGKPCVPGGRRCCNGRTCGGPPESRFCCKQGGEPCEKNRHCCNLACIARECALN
jgi:hypothetical protein